MILFIIDIRCAYVVKGVSVFAEQSMYHKIAYLVRAEKSRDIQIFTPKALARTKKWFDQCLIKALTYITPNDVTSI